MFVDVLRIHNEHEDRGLGTGNIPYVEHADTVTSISIFPSRALVRA